jgi:hypothetical protein
MAARPGPRSIAGSPEATAKRASLRDVSPDFIIEFTDGSQLLGETRFTRR